MAITLKPMNAIAAMSKLGISSHNLEWLEASPVTVQLTGDKFHFELNVDDMAPLVMTIPVTIDTLHKINAGYLGPALKQGLCSEVMNVISTYAATLSALSDPMVDEAKAKAAKTGQPVVTAVQNKLPPLGTVTPAKAKQAPLPAYPQFDLTKLKTAQPVKLRDAMMMYQPVTGTSAGSRYFMIAAGPGIRIAVRYKGGSLSIRVEGSDMQKYLGAIDGSGMQHGADYASIHLDVGSVAMARKTLGSVLLGLGIPLETPIPDLMKVLT